jgi:hypothetical protein
LFDCNLEKGGTLPRTNSQKLPVLEEEAEDEFEDMSLSEKSDP